MNPKPDESVKRIEKYLLENAAPEGKPGPKDSQEKPPVKKETPKNDEYNTYEYSDNPDEEDKNW